MCPVISLVIQGLQSKHLQFSCTDSINPSLLFSLNDVFRQDYSSDHLDTLAAVVLLCSGRRKSPRKSTMLLFLHGLVLWGCRLKVIHWNSLLPLHPHSISLNPGTRGVRNVALFSITHEQIQSTRVCYFQLLGGLCPLRVIT